MPTPGAPYQVPPEPNRWPSIALAGLIHAALLAFLWIGVSWQNTEPVSVEAEVWDMKTESAAPPAPPPVEQVAPPPVPEPMPAPKVTPPPAPPVEVKVTPKPPDIALEREKQRKLQREEERKERELAEREDQKRQDLADKKAREKAEKLAEKLAEKKERDAADKKAQELADKLADKKDAEKLAADKKKAAEKLAKAKEAVEDKKRKENREAEIRRLTSQAGNGSSGTAAKSTGPRLDAGYQAAIAGKVKRSTSYTGDTSLPGNPRAEFVIDQLPTGEIISVRKTKSSGIPAFDAAVERGILGASPLPKKKDGTVERSFPIGVAMKDLE